ncbi:hypothetical protein BOX15_Mlig000565g1, partial [Macrostomum lignano]
SKKKQQIALSMMQKLMRACISKNLPPGNTGNADLQSNNNNNNCSHYGNNGAKPGSSCRPQEQPDAEASSPVQTRRKHQRWHHKSLTLSLIRSPWRRSNADNNNKDSKKQELQCNSSQSVAGDSSSFSQSLTTRSVTMDHFPNPVAPSATPESVTPTSPALPCQPLAEQDAPVVESTVSSRGGSYRDYKSTRNSYISEPRQLGSSFNPDNYRRPNNLPLLKMHQLQLSQQAGRSRAVPAAAASSSSCSPTAPAAAAPSNSSLRRRRYESGGSVSVNSDDLMLDTDVGNLLDEEDLLSELGTPAAEGPPSAFPPAAGAVRTSGSFRRTASLRQRRQALLSSTAMSHSMTSATQQRPRSISSPPPPADDAVLVGGSDLRQLAQEAAAMRLALLRLRRQLMNDEPVSDAAGSGVCAACGLDAKRVRLLETRVAELQAEADRLRTAAE